MLQGERGLLKKIELDLNNSGEVVSRVISATTGLNSWEAAKIL